MNGCAGHAGVTGELRALAEAALERLGPALERLRPDPADLDRDDPGSPTACAVCPVCAVIAALRGERPELLMRVAEQVSGLVALLRAVLAEPEPDPAADDAEDATRRPAGGPRERVVQRIPVTRC